MSNEIPNMYVNDFPKIESPFVREETDEGYYVTPEINEGYEWVFEDDEVLAVEKLHGTNVCVRLVDGRVTGVWNRKERIPRFSKDQGHKYINDGVLESLNRGYVDRLSDGLQYGEVIGEKFHNNPYDIEGHIWIPFEWLKEKCHYRSWGDYPKDYETISRWFKEDLIPMFYARWHGLSFEEVVERDEFIEGLVFHHPDGRMAKLRKDMFPWYGGE